MTQLMFEQEKPEKFGMSQDVNHHQLIKFLQKKENGLQLVFVSACYSQKAGEAFIQAGVPYVICIKWTDAVQTEAAIEFMKIFYEYFLMHNYTIPEAFDYSKFNLEVKKQVVSANMFELFENETLPKDILHDSSKIKLQEGVFRDVSHQLKRGVVKTARIPRARIDLTGNVLWKKKVIQGLMTKRLVVIYNNRYRKIGKTAIAIMSAYYIVDRGKVNRLIWVDKKSIRRIQSNRRTIAKMSLDLILCTLLLEELEVYEKDSDRVKDIKLLLNPQGLPVGERSKSGAPINQEFFSQIITEFFEKEIVLIILDGADSWCDSWFQSNRKNKNVRSSKLKPESAPNLMSLENDLQMKEDLENSRHLEPWSSSQASRFIFESTKNHNHLKILVTCREWTNKGKLAAVDDVEMIELPRLSFKNAALLFIKSIPNRKKLRAEHFGMDGFGGLLSPNDIAKKLSVRNTESLTISATGRIPGVIKRIAKSRYFLNVESVEHSWDKQELLRVIKGVMCKHKIKYKQVKDYILEHLVDDRDDVIYDLYRNFSRYSWHKSQIEIVYNHLCIPSYEKIWETMQQRAKCLEDGHRGWTYILELESNRVQNSKNEWTKDVQNWKKQLALVFPDKSVRYQHVLYSTVEVLRRLMNPKSRKWGFWETDSCIELMKYFCINRDVPPWVMYKPTFEKYYERIYHSCKILSDYRDYFDTGINGPCLLNAFVRRETSTMALRGKLCQDCQYNDTNNEYECAKFPNGHPEVPPGSFLLRMGITSENFVVVFKSEEGTIIHKKIYSGLTTEGYNGFSEKPRPSGKNKYYSLPELVMRMVELKYVFWPGAPIDPRSGAPVRVHKEYCYENSFVPG